MQTFRNRLSDIRRRIAEAEHRLVELERSTQDRRLTAMLIDSVTATLKLLREHAARLESRSASARAGDSRR